jgi:hypothetical protein
VQPIAAAIVPDAGLVDAPDAGALAEAPTPAAVDAGTPVMAEAAGFPNTKLDDVKAAGGLDTKTVAVMLLKHRSELAVCYERELALNPELAGTLAVRFAVTLPEVEGRTPPVLRAILAGKGKKPAMTSDKPEDKPADTEAKPEKSAKKAGKGDKKEDEEQSPEGDGSMPKTPPTKTAPSYGVVTKLQVVNTTLENKGLVLCLLARIGSWRFPAPARGAAAVAASWTFAPTGAEARQAPMLQAPPTKPKALSRGSRAGTTKE